MAHEGQCAQAEIVELNPIKTDIGKTWYKMRYSITIPGASEPTFIDINSDTPNGLGDEQREDIVYDPLDPESAVFLDTLPSVTWDPKSGWVSSSHHITLAALALPLPGLWVFWKFLTLLT